MLAVFEFKVLDNKIRLQRKVPQGHERCTCSSPDQSSHLEKIEKLSGYKQSVDVKSFREVKAV
jgi:hypothetical protein